MSHPNYNRQPSYEGNNGRNDDRRTWNAHHQGNNGYRENDGTGNAQYGPNDNSVLHILQKERWENLDRENSPRRSRSYSPRDDHRRGSPDRNDSRNGYNNGNNRYVERWDNSNGEESRRRSRSPLRHNGNMQAFDNFNGQNQRTFYYQAGNVQISAKINLPEGTCGDDMQPSWHIGNRQAQDQRRDSRMGSNVNNDGMRNTDQSLRRQEISCTPPMRYENRHGSQHFHERQQQMSSNNVGNEQRSEGRGTVGQYCNGQVITPPSREERMRELNGQNQRQPRCYLGANGNFNGTRPNDATRPPMSNGSKKKAKASRRDDSSDDDLYADDPNDPDYDPHLHMIVVSTKKEPVMPEQQSLSLTGDENHQNEGSNNMDLQDPALPRSHRRRQSYNREKSPLRYATMQRLNEFINLAKEQVSQGVNERRTSIMERIVEETEDFNKPAEFENLTITVTEDKEKAKRVLEKFEKHPTVPIYFDSEHSYIRLKNDTKVAAIQLYDSCTRHVLVWRLHNADHEYLKGVREQLELLSKARMFATFGKEEFLENAIKYVTKDLQVNQKSLEALLLKKEIVITKWETFSDWTRPVLRPSQERYAVYDVIRLFDLDQ